MQRPRQCRRPCCLLQATRRSGRESRCDRPGGQTPLHYAAGKKEAQPFLVPMLIEAGVNVNVACSNGITPLHNAAKFGDDHGQPLLVKAGAAVSGDTGNSPLHSQSLAANATSAPPCFAPAPTIRCVCPAPRTRSVRNTRNSVRRARRGGFKERAGPPREAHADLTPKFRVSRPRWSASHRVLAARRLLLNVLL